MAMALSSSSSSCLLRLSSPNKGGGRGSAPTISMANHRLVLPPCARRVRGRMAAAAVTRCSSNQEPQTQGRGEEEEGIGIGIGGGGGALDLARLSSDDLSYLWSLLAGSFGGASAIKYGIVLFPDVTKPDIVQALLMVSLPLLVAIVILVKKSEDLF